MYFGEARAALLEAVRARQDLRHAIFRKIPDHLRIRVMTSEIFTTNLMSDQTWAEVHIPSWLQPPQQPVRLPRSQRALTKVNQNQNLLIALRQCQIPIMYLIIIVILSRRLLRARSPALRVKESLYLPSGRKGSKAHLPLRLLSLLLWNLILPAPQKTEE